MLKVDVFSNKGIKKNSVVLPKEYAVKPNEALLSQALRVYESRKHPGFARVKTRGEVAISTRKIYRQKGTGRARHGAKSAPIFVGGGVAHGPKGIKRVLVLPEKMRAKALAVSLSYKALEKNLIIADGLSLLKQTKDACFFVEKLMTNFKEIKRLTLVFAKDSKNRSAFRNLKNVRVLSFDNLNAHDIFWGGLIVVDDNAVFKKKAVKKSPEKKKE